MVYLLQMGSFQFATLVITRWCYVSHSQKLCSPEKSRSSWATIETSILTRSQWTKFPRLRQSWMIATRQRLELGDDFDGGLKGAPKRSMFLGL